MNQAQNSALGGLGIRNPFVQVRAEDFERKLRDHAHDIKMAAGFTAPVAKEASEVADELDSLNSAVSDLHGAINVLVERLAPVTHGVSCSPPPCPETEVKMSPVGNSIRNERLRVRDAAERLHLAIADMAI